MDWIRIVVCWAGLTGVVLGIGTARDIDTAIPAGAVAADLDRLRNHVGGHLRGAR